MTDLIDTTEMYLKAIYELEEENIPPMRARIAERLDHSGPTVSQTVARMERDGLLRLLDDRQLQFTDVGRLTAVEVHARRHSRNAVGGGARRGLPLGARDERTG